MNFGRVYLWRNDAARPLGGQVCLSEVPLPRLEMSEKGRRRLRGAFVHVRNGGSLHEKNDVTGEVRAVPLGDAAPNAAGDFLFEPQRGGSRLDTHVLPPPFYRWRYIQAARFGEVNAYYHLDRIAAYIHGLLCALDAEPLPPVTAVVQAHGAATVRADGTRDGLLRHGRWLPFQGGHYRLPARRHSVPEYAPLCPSGEIHLGPGWQLLTHGALVEAAGTLYRHNASHNAGTLYHEYGHHLTRHTADFRANTLRPADRQDNRKTAMDEGYSDYWAATMLGTPHIWAWHRRHDDEETHARSLTSSLTMANFQFGPAADPHANGTIWASALWDFRTRLTGHDPASAPVADLIVLHSLCLLGQVAQDSPETAVETASQKVTRVRQAREPYAIGLAALLRADETLFGGQYRTEIKDAFRRRGIRPASNFAFQAVPSPHRTRAAFLLCSPEPEHAADVMASKPFQNLSKRISPEEIPGREELLSAEALAARLESFGEPPLTLLGSGDIMLGGRMTPLLREHGALFPFHSVQPLLRSADIVIGNLEGPFARHAAPEDRRYSYRVNPHLASSLAQANISVVTIANNHLMDCGRQGILETIEALAAAHVDCLGGGVNTAEAHRPVVREASGMRIGLLGYYWNRRTAATATLPGSAQDTEETLAQDIDALRGLVDRIVVNFHWGVPYERAPLEEDRAKARFALDRGADAVLGHHPHVIQPFEIYRGKPIFYSVGNFAFGSGNSRAEGLLVGLRFEDSRTCANFYPIYVKNRDPRANYQPKVLRGGAAARVLGRLAEVSGSDGSRMEIEDIRGRIEIPRPPAATGRNTRV